MSRSFASSEFGSLGVEFESEIIDRDTSLPLPIASSLSTQVQPLLERGSITPDLFDSTLEFATGVCTSIDDVAEDLRTISDTLRPASAARNAALLGMGLHPFADSSATTVAPGARYQEIMQRIAWPATQVHTNALQIHVGMPSGDRAVATANSLRSVLPILLALSASSPFRGGRSTGLASTRSALFAMVPRSGPMPVFDGWDAYANYFETMIRADSMPSVLHTWWDCRLQPRLGTIEVRIADSIADLDDILGLVALAWCMSVGIERIPHFDLPPVISDENRWRATRYGSSARFLTDASGSSETLPRIVERLLVALEPTAESLDCRHHLDRCVAMSTGLAVHQRLVPPETSRSEGELAERAARSMRVTW